MSNIITKINVGSSDYSISDSRLITLTDNGSTTAGAWIAIADPTLTEYVDGQLFLYKITVAGASTTTLNIDGLGAKTIYRTSSSKLTTHYPVGHYILLAYNSSGTCFRVINDYNGEIPAGYCTTAAGTAAKVATHSSYVLRTGNYELITIASTNTSKTALTLNINSTGAKPIYINGSASSTSNYTLPAGTYLIYYDGTNYQFRTDNIIPGKVVSASSADKDASGNTITTTYLVKNSAITAGTATKVTYDSKGLVTSGTSLSASDLPSHTHSVSNISDITATAAEINVLDGITASTSELNVLDGITASTTELNYTDGVTSNIQTQLNGKQATLATQTAYTSKGSATKVPQITTNNLGQVTGITEVTITQPTVNNGTLNLQIEGTTKATFNANQSGTSTFNVTAESLGLSSALRFIGVGQTTAPTAGNYVHDATTGLYIPVTTSGTATEIDAKKGDVFKYGSKEYVFTTAGKYATPNASIELGDESEYAHKGATTSVANANHTHTVVATGTVSQPTFTGTEGTTGTANLAHTHTVTAAGSVANHSHTIGFTTTTVNKGYTHTAASLTGTTTFNTDAINSASLVSTTTQDTESTYLPYIESATAPSLTGTKTFLSSVKANGSASLGGTTSFNTDAIKDVSLATYTQTATGRVAVIYGGSTTSVVKGITTTSDTFVKSYPGSASNLVTTSITGVSGSTTASKVSVSAVTASKATAGTAVVYGTADVGSATTVVTGVTGSFNTGAIKSATLSSYTQTATGRVSYITGTGSTASVVTGVTSDGTTTALTGVKVSATATVPVTFSTTSVLTGVTGDGTANAYTGIASNQTVVTGVSGGGVSSTTSVAVSGITATVSGTVLTFSAVSTTPVVTGIAAISAPTTTVPKTFSTTSVLTGVKGNGTANAYTGVATTANAATAVASNGTATVLTGVKASGTTTAITGLSSAYMGVVTAAAGTASVTVSTTSITPAKAADTTRTITPYSFADVTASSVSASDVTVPKAGSATTVATGSLSTTATGAAVLVGLGTASTASALTSASASGTTNAYTGLSTTYVGATYSAATKETVTLSHSDPTFNSGTVGITGGAHTTKYMYVTTTAANTGTVGINGGSITSTGTTTVVTGVDANTGNTQPKFTGSSATTSSALTTHSHTYTPEGTVSQPTFSGTTATTSASGSNHYHTLQ